MLTERCPTAEQIRDFLLGRNADDSDLSSHLDECQACGRLADELDSTTDSVVADLRVVLNDSEFDTGDLSGTDLGDYQLIRRIGVGGMGTVYQGLHTHLKKLVAIKVLPLDSATSKASLPRFRKEMEAAARVDHAHVVRAMDAREVDGRHFLVMEHVEGVDLSRLVKLIGPLAIIDACEIVRQAALGIESIHAANMIHRDIKPSNLILSSDGTVKVVDLGLAFLRSSVDAVEAEPLECMPTELPETSVEEASWSRITRTGHHLGTAKYVAPEQALGLADVDHRADIFSLGCTLFYLLTGDVPYAAPGNGESKGVGKGPSVRKLRKHVPTALDELVGGMIARAVDHRCGHARDVADRLESVILAEEIPTTSLPEDPEFAGLVELSRRTTERIRADRQRRYRRRYVIASISVLLLLALVAASVLPAHLRTPATVVAEPLPEPVEEAGPPLKVVTMKMTPEELAGIKKVQFSPDLSRLVVVNSDSAQIWDTKTGERLFDGTLPEQEATTSHVALDIAGSRLLDLTTPEQRELNAQLLDKAAGDSEPTENSATPRSRTDGIKNWEPLVTRASSTKYAAKVEANKVLFFDMSKKINALVDVAISPIEHLELSGDGRVVAIGGEDKLALWDFDTQTRLRENNVGAMKRVCLSNDGSVLARISAAGELIVHELAAEVEARPFSNAIADVAEFAWHAPVLAYGDRTGVVALWNCDLFDFFTDYHLETADDELLLSIAFSRDGKELAVASSRGKVYWIAIDLSRIARESDLDAKQTSLELVATLSGHESRVTSLAFSRDGGKLAAGGDDRSIRIFDVASGQLDSTHLVHDSFVRTVRFLPGQSLLVSTSEDGTVKGFDWPTMAERVTLAIPGRPTTLAAFQENGRIAVGTANGEVFTVSAEAGAGVMRLDTSPEPNIELALCTSATGELFVGNQNGRISVYQGTTGELVQTIPTPDHTITSLALSPDQQVLVAGTMSGMIGVFRWRGAELIARWLAHAAPVNAVTFSHHGDYIASACRLGDLKVWNSKTFRLKSTTRAHQDMIRDIQFAPDDQFIASGSHDGLVRLWRMSRD